MKYRTAALPLAAGLIGVLAWNGHAAALLLLPLITLLWSLCPGRRLAFTTLLCYYAGASRGMLHGAGIFYADANAVPAVWIGPTMWLLSSALLASVWSIGWGEQWKPVRLLAVLLAVSLPPIGVIGWANPITAAGVVFPGLGWFGLGALLLLLCLLVSRPRPLLMAPFLLVAALANAGAERVDDHKHLQGVDTNLGGGSSLSAEFSRLTHLQAKAGQMIDRAQHGALILFPEMVGGDWTLNAMWWQDLAARARAKDLTVLIGVHWPAPRGDGYTSGLVAIGSNDGTVMKDRVPVPIAMWRPWSNDGAVAGWLETGVTLIGDKRVGHLICYEQILVWPVLATFAKSPDVIVAPANVWWAKETSVPAIQRQAVEAWSRLFAVPAISAANT